MPERKPREGARPAPSTPTTERQPTPLELAVRANPNQIHRLIPGGNELLIITEDWDGKHPYGRNSRPTPPIGSPVLKDLIRDMERHTNEEIGDYGQLQPGAAVLNADGAAELYFGFHRARAIQTRNMARSGDQILMNVIITDRILTEDEIVARSLSENAFRRDPGPMQIAETVASMQAQGLGVVEIGKRIGKPTSAVSVYGRLGLLPANARKALESGKLDFAKARTLMPMLPGKVELRDNPECLKPAQVRIAARVEKILGKGKGEKVERVKYRPVPKMLEEIGVQMETSGANVMTAKNRALTAFQKYLAGGSIQALVKGLK